MKVQKNVEAKNGGVESGGGGGGQGRGVREGGSSWGVRVVVNEELKLLRNKKKIPGGGGVG